MTINATEMAILRRAAAQRTGSAFKGWSIGQRLRHCMARYQVIRKADGQVAGFGHEGFTLTPNGEALFTWGEERAKLAFIEAA